MSAASRLDAWTGGGGLRTGADDEVVERHGRSISAGAGLWWLRGACTLHTTHEAVGCDMDMDPSAILLPLIASSF